ncbi:MAG: hypothetical protein NTY10_01420 [Candidatus Omnitrophica bacterium]|nr:hypothetical protein [Candidatus Omnitrophota bacterium]
MRIFNRLVAWIYSIASLYVSVLFLLIWLDKEFSRQFFQKIEAIHPYKFAIAGGGLLFLGALWLVSAIEHHYRTRSVSFSGPGGLVRVHLSAIEDFLVNEIHQRIKAVKRIRVSTITAPKGLQVYNQVIIWAGYDIPTTTGKIQDLVKRLLQDTIGVERLGEIKVLVYRIATTGEGTTSKEDEESELEDTENG